MTIRVGINGFGRIGRVVFRAAMKQKDIEIVHINDLTDTETLAHLLQYDSVHGQFGTSEGHDGKGASGQSTKVHAEGDTLVVGDRKVSVSAVRNPLELPWQKKSVDIVFECTGLFTKREDAALHLKAGAKKVLISAPATGEDLTVVYGVNHKLIKPEHTILSNGSCTTNCLAPIAKVLHEEFGIKAAQMTTIHSYTNDQRILDLPHKDLRRSRAAALSMIPTSTGAAKAVSLVIPELAGKFQGLSVRVPTPNVSLVDLTAELNKSCTIESVNAALKRASEGSLKGILGYSESPLVSIDYNGCTYSSYIDSLCTSVSGGQMVKILSWYDNESGFSHRMLDVAKLMA